MSQLSLGPSRAATMAGTLLQMAPQVRPPARKPVPGSLVDPKPFSKLLADVSGHASVAEFPLRKTIHATNSTVYTNHFALKLDTRVPLYKYHITGFPTRIGKRTAKALVQALIQANDFLRGHQQEFVTDYRGELISWVKIPEEWLRSSAVTSRPDRETVNLEIWYKETVDVGLLTQYAAGKAQPTEVYHASILSFRTPAALVSRNYRVYDILCIQQSPSGLTWTRKPARRLYSLIMPLI